MFAPKVRLGLIVVLTSCPMTGILAQGSVDQSTADAEGQRNGAIHSLGAAGYNGRGNDQAPAVIIPPLNEGPSGTSGVPLGTTVGPRIR